MVEKVFEFPKGRAKPLSEAEAFGRLFDQICREGCVEVQSIAALGKAWGWEQSRERADHIIREHGAGGKLVIRFPEHERLEQEPEGHERHEQGKRACH